MYSLYHFNFIIIFLKTYRKWFVNEKLFRKIPLNDYLS